MTSLNFYDALEICLQSLDRGADLESCLVRFPEFSDELRPVLIAAIRARSISAKTVPVDVARRGKARVLQAAAEMREQKKAFVPVLPFWRRGGFFSVRFARLAVSSLAVVIFLLTGGTGLVNASSSALPGDHLYPVKRSWEGVRLIFVFDEHTKEKLSHEFDNERVHEIEELYSEKRIAEVNFQGIVQEQKDKTWIIGGLNILIDKETSFSPNILPGSMVQVMGETDDGHIKAQRIILLATPGVTPSPFVTATGTSTSTPVPSATPDIGENENDAESTLIPAPTGSTDDSSELQEASTPRPGGDGSGDDNSEHNTPGPTPTGDHHDDDEHHATRTPNPTEGHDDDSRTPTSTREN